MRIRGKRECRDCGARWSYYETGSVACPECGGLASRGLEDERRLHTAGADELDLSPVRAAADERPLPEVVAEAKSTCRAYVRADGFLKGGELLAPSATHLAAREVVHAADLVGRSLDHSEAAELYLLSLLDGADRGERPPADAVPRELRSARGLAVAATVEALAGEVRDWLDEHADAAGTELVASLDQHATRVRALQGDVPPADAERLVTAARELVEYLREGDEPSLATAHERLERLADGVGGDPDADA